MFAHERASSFLQSLFTFDSPFLILDHLFDIDLSADIAGSEHHCADPRNEVYGSLAISTPPTGYEPNVTDNSEDIEVTASFFQDSNVTSIYDLGDNGAESPDAEIDDEHVRNALASTPYIQEREASASLLQTYHSNDESLLSGARSILASTVEPVAWLSQRRKSRQEFARNSEVWFRNCMLLHAPSVFLSSELLLFFFVLQTVSLTVATSPVGLVASSSTSLVVLAAVDRGTNSCRGPFLPSCGEAYVRPEQLTSWVLEWTHWRCRIVSYK